MSGRKHSATADLGPDLLSRYLHVYMESRQMTDLERPWGLGDDGLHEVWISLVAAQSNDPARVNRIVEQEISERDRMRMIETLVPLIFALPLRVFPAELRAQRNGCHLSFVLVHDGEKQHIGYLPSALEPSFKTYLRRALGISEHEKHHEAVISSGGRRRRVSVALPPDGPGARATVVRFIEKLHSPAEEH